MTAKRNTMNGKALAVRRDRRVKARHDAVLPVVHRARTPTLESDFYLWPVYKYNRAHIDPSTRAHPHPVFPVFGHHPKDTESGASSGGRLLAFLHPPPDYDGSTRLQIGAFLEPYLPNNKSIERDYSHSGPSGARKRTLGRGRPANRCSGICIGVTSGRLEKMLAPFWAFPVSIRYQW